MSHQLSAEEFGNLRLYISVAPASEVLARCTVAVPRRFTLQATWCCKSQRPHTSLAGHLRKHLYFRCYNQVTQGSDGPCFLVASSDDDFRLALGISWTLAELAAFSAPKRST